MSNKKREQGETKCPLAPGEVKVGVLTNEPSDSF